jgi:hypothetical protein
LEEEEAEEEEQLIIVSRAVTVDVGSSRGYQKDTYFMFKCVPHGFVILSGVDTQENFSYFRKVQGSNP